MKQIGRLTRAPFHLILRLAVGSALLSQALVSAHVYAAANNNTTQYGYSNLYGELTPTQVFTLVKNIDAMINLYAKREKPELTNLLPRRIIQVQGYKPEQVFVALNSLADRVDALAQESGTTLRVRRVTREKEEAIPAEVFLLAGACLDTMAGTLFHRDPSTPLGDLYSFRISTRSMTPSDVYALVNLLDRKLSILLSEQFAQ